MRKSILMTLAAGILLMPLMASAEAPASASAPAAPAIGIQPAKTVTDNSTIAKPGKPAQEAASQPTSAEGESTTQPAKSFWDKYMLFIMMGGIILLYVWMGRGKKKQEQQRRAMLSALKKGDKITTIGGIVGTVIEVRDTEVTVKTDETNNVRMKFARWAIRDIGEPGKGDQQK